MEITFCDADLWTVFNRHRLLERQYGAELAASISVIMSMLAAASSLAGVPREPPVGLTFSGTTLTVNLIKDKLLRFQPATPTIVSIETLAAISHIEILGVE